MGPFTQRPSEREEQNTWERPERDFHLRVTRDDEVPQPTRYSYDEQEDHKAEYHQGKDIRNLGFFKEQERQFTQTEDEEEWQERQSPINFVLISCIFVVLCVVGWFGYRWASKPISGEPPLITAESTPFKVRPENPGGMVIPHQDKLIYGRIAPDQQQPVEHLLPAPEQPIAPPSSPQAQPQTFVDANGQVYYAYPVPQQPIAPQQQHPNQQAYAPHNGYVDYYGPTQANNYHQGTSPAPQQAPQQQVAHMQPGMQAPQAQPQQAMPAIPQQQRYAPQPGYTPPAQPNPMVARQAPMEAQQLPSAEPRQLSNQQPMAPLQQNFVPAAQPLAVPANAPVQVAPETQHANPTSDKDALDQLIEQEMGSPALTKPSKGEEQITTKTKDQRTKITSSPYKLQVATLDSMADAEKEAKRIRAIDKNLFSDKIISIDEITLSGTKKTSYRVIINGFDTPNAATQFSNKLKIHKVKGIVLRQPT